MDNFCSRLSLWYVAVCIVAASLSSGELLRTNHEQGTRWRRAMVANPRVNCGTWSQWTNTHHPSSTGDTSDIEQVPKPDMDAFCPPLYGGNVSDIMCKDERGEPFQGNQTDNKSGHTISCENPYVGAVCHLLPHHTVEHCPDLSFQYYCSCSNKTLVVTTTTPSTVQTIPTTRQISIGIGPHTVIIRRNKTENDQVGQRMLVEEDGSSVEGLLIPWWILSLLVSFILFVISMCTTICLYRHLKRKLVNRKITKVNPLQHV